MNICGCLVHIAPAQAQAASATMKNTPGVEVHAEAEDGRFVIVVEDTPTRLSSEIIMDMHQIPGVISLTLTYHHFEDLADGSTYPDAPSQLTSRRPKL
jgi:nitrate reductase NapD